LPLSVGLIPLLTLVVAPVGDRPQTDYQLAQDVVSIARNLSRSRSPALRTCSGYVEAVYARVGVSLAGGTGDLWRRAVDVGAIHYHTRPRIGDIAYFDNTFDANMNRRADDPLTHVALVLDVSADGTILLAHGGSRTGMANFHMNLEHPEDMIGPSGERWNDYIRARRRSDPPDTEYLASMLFAGFATVWLGDIDAWSAPVLDDDEDDTGF
jgi:surface antigen